MKSTLQRGLYQFLEHEGISPYSGIINDIIYQLVDIHVTKEQLEQGLTFEHGKIVDEIKVYFLVPTGLDFSQIKKLLTLFNIPENQYQPGTPMVLNDAALSVHFIADFKNCFMVLKQNSPEVLARYKALSAPILELEVKGSLKRHSDKIKLIIKESYPNTLFTETIKKLTSFISTLAGRIQDLEEFPHFYQDIVTSQSEINNFLQSKEISENKKISAQLIMMLENIALFERYHRSESILNNARFYEEFKEFLIPYRINPEKCDLLGHMILSLANIDIDSESLFRISAGDDRARLVMTFRGMHQERASQFIQYMHLLGDETVFERNEKKHFSSAPYLGAVMKNQGYTGPQQEEHTVKVDGTFFYTRVFPKIKETIAAMALQHRLNSYQEQSKDDFKFTKESTRVSEYSLFEKKQDPSLNHSVKSDRSCLCTLLRP